MSNERRQGQGRPDRRPVRRRLFANENSNNNRNRKINITLHLKSGAYDINYTYEVKSSTTIYKLRAKLWELLGFTIRIRIIHNGVQLYDDEKTLSDYNIKNNSIIFAMFDLSRAQSKNSHLQNFKVKLMKSSLNNFNQTVERIKNRIIGRPNLFINDENPSHDINKNDINNIVRNIKPHVLQKIYNKLKNSPSNQRNSIMNTMKNRGLMNRSDITWMKKRLLGSNFVRNSKKTPPTTTLTRKGMNSNNARKSPYI